MSFANSFMTALITSPLHFLLGSNLAVITVTGRKTGNLIRTPINVAWDGQGYTATSMRDRQWWRNLRGGGTAHLHLQGRSFPVQGMVMENVQDARQGLQEYFLRFPHLARFFKVHLTSEGKLDPVDLDRLAQERVVIKLCPKG